MSEPVGSSSTPSGHTKNPAGNKRKDTDISSVPPSPKRPHTDPHSSGSNEETKDTANSINAQQQLELLRQQQQDGEEEEEPESSDSEDEIKLVDYPDIAVYEELEDHEFISGSNPVEDSYEMKFYWGYHIDMRVGNRRGWKAKIEHLRDKFKNMSEDSVPYYLRKEFFLWQKMFNRPVPDDAASRNRP